MFVLFGGGDAGGIYIGPDGKVHRIPPWNPEVLNQLKAVKALVAASTTIKDGALGKEISALAERISTSVIPHAANIAGASKIDGGIAFFDPDGGFTCGTKGQHPVPFPGPHINIPGYTPMTAEASTMAR